LEGEWDEERKDWRKEDVLCIVRMKILYVGYNIELFGN
jgi:hypothetical protein